MIAGKKMGRTAIWAENYVFRSENIIKGCNLIKEARKTPLVARKAAAAQRKNPKTTFFGFFPRIPARTAG